MVVDGLANSTTRHNHTDLEFQPWGEVDLEEVTEIESIRIHNRVTSDSNLSNRLSKFYVFISEKPIPDLSVKKTRDLNGIRKIYVDSVDSVKDINVHSEGRFVKIQLSAKNYLHMGEVEVLRRVDSSPASTGPVNLALGKTAKQSTNLSSNGSNQALLAVDGNKTSSSNHSHTGLQFQP